MVKHYGCKIKPYLVGDKNNDVNMESKVCVNDESISDSINSEDKSDAEHDYTVEKFIFYDDFVKKLQIVNIIHTACMMCQELVGVGYY